MPGRRAGVVARLKVLKPEGDFQLADLPQAIHGAQPLPAIPPNAAPLAATGVDLYAALGELEDRLIREALERSGGTRTRPRSLSASTAPRW